VNTAGAGHPPALITSEEAMSQSATTSPIPTLDGGQVHVDTHRFTEPGEPDLFETVVSVGDLLLVLDPAAARELARRLVAGQPKPRQCAAARFPHRSRWI
jgi:hypothetical protein